jgi:hypothetical protein
VSKTRLLTLTLVVHAVLALVVATDARRQGRSVGKWVAVTLLTGLVGVIVYAFTRGNEDPPLDELVDQVELE